MEAGVLFLALLSVASAFVFEMSQYFEKMEIRRRPDFDSQFEDGLMYGCCDTKDPNGENKNKERDLKIQQECCDEIMPIVYGRDQRRGPPPRRHRQYMNETAADSEGNVKDGMTETVATSLGITSTTVIQEAERICYNRTQDTKDKFTDLTCNVAPYMFLKCIRELNNLHCENERKSRGPMCERYVRKLNQTYYNQN